MMFNANKFMTIDHFVRTVGSSMSMRKETSIYNSARKILRNHKRVNNLSLKPAFVIVKIWSNDVFRIDKKQSFKSEDINKNISTFRVIWQQRPAIILMT